MTAAAASTTENAIRPNMPGPPRLPDWARIGPGQAGLGSCLVALDAAIDAARALGVRTHDAEAVRSEALARLGFPADTYVLGLVGGTGVGKSSLLNALAGAEVSRASARRPTTGSPIAWIPRSAGEALDGLLDWLGVRPDDVRRHDGSGPDDVAILDLPDLDSIDPSHRARVEEVLPRLDAVAWVTDPEKYHDAALHDDYLLHWLPRLDRQVVIVNKTDRLTAGDAERIRRDLEGDVGAALPADAPGRPPVILAAAVQAASAGGSGPGPLDELRRWLAGGVEAKHVVRRRLATAIAEATEALAREAGIDASTDAAPILDAAARRAAIDQATTELLRVVDLPAVERQAVAATRARARAKGAGPLGAITSLIYRLSGRQARVADPAGFLSRWRERGSLASAVESLRGALAEPLRTAAPATRSTLAGSVAAVGLEAGLAGAVDRAISRRGTEAPSSRAWPLIGLLQAGATLALVFAALWVVLWVLVKFPVDTVEVVGLGRLPVPFVVLVGALLAGYLSARLLGLHAGAVGRAWARDLGEAVRANVAREVEASAFDGFDRLEAARHSLWTAARDAATGCRAG